MEASGETSTFQDFKGPSGLTDAVKWLDTIAGDQNSHYGKTVLDKPAKVTKKKK